MTDTSSAPKTQAHCWKGGPLTKDGCSTTCVLPDQHDGPHEWTRDDQIVIKLAPQAPQPDHSPERCIACGRDSPFEACDRWDCPFLLEKSE